MVVARDGMAYTACLSRRSGFTIQMSCQLRVEFAVSQTNDTLAP